MSHNTEALIEVKIVYPSGHHPAEKQFARESTLREVKGFALEFFRLQEMQDGNNQIVFFLYLGDDKLDDLNQQLSALANGRKKLNFRLAKEVIAG